MSDAVKLSDDDFRRTYELGFRTWAALASSKVPASDACVTDALLHQPPLPRGLRLKREYGHVFATGSSLWETRGGTCDLPAFQTQVQIGITRDEPMQLFISAAAQDKLGSFFSSSDENFVAVLVLAWAYVLSARWAEIISEPCLVKYTRHRARTADTTVHQKPNDSNAIEIAIPGASPAEVRWWAAVLAQGRGWQARMLSDDRARLSPWSIHLRSTQNFMITADSQPSEAHGPAPSFSEANAYLHRFCQRHGIFDQSRAALAAALLLPCFGGGPELQLPACRIGNQQKGQDATYLGQDQTEYETLNQPEYLDRCLALSCHVKGIRPILQSVFFEPSIECNAVTPWLRGSLAAISSVAGGKPHVIWSMVASRAPAVAWLWLGAIVLGIQEQLLREVRFGQIPIDLTSSAWSGTVQSFMQASTTKTGVKDGSIPRADECRLLFAAQTSHHSRFPTCQWKPFGSIRLADADIEVRNHVDCQDHELRYGGFSWDCTDGTTTWPPQKTEMPAGAGFLADSAALSVQYPSVNRAGEFISHVATRSIFAWLRSDGHAPHEQAIWDHEWFAALDWDDGDDDLGGQKTGAEDQIRTSYDVRAWLSTLTDAKPCALAEG